MLIVVRSDTLLASEPVEGLDFSPFWGAVKSQLSESCSPVSFESEALGDFVGFLLESLGRSYSCGHTGT